MSEMSESGEKKETGLLIVQSKVREVIRQKEKRVSDDFLNALSEHVLIAPEGDASRRRHAHTECAVAARKAGRLPTIDEWRATSVDERPRGLARPA